MQVTADCPGREEQSLGDLLVRQAGCGQQCDLSLLGCERRRGVVVDAWFRQADPRATRASREDSAAIFDS
jgi:hypothetical protein